jgi:hypothetical protein
MNINNNNNLLTANGLSSGGSGTRAIEEVKWKNAKKSCEEHGKTCR